MRLLSTSPDHDHARRFGDYLLTEGIRCSIDAMTGGWGIWVERDDDLPRAEQEWQRFSANPSDLRYNAARSEADRLRKQDQVSTERRRRQFIDVRTHWAGAALRPRPVTFALIGLSIILTLATRFGRPAGAWLLDWLRFAHTQTLQVGDQVMVRFSAVADLMAGQVWRPISPIFIHFDPLHLIFNLYWVFLLGSMIEARRGSLRLAVLVLLGAVLPNTAEYLWSGPMFGGMSGVVYALFGYVWIKGRLQPHHGLGLHQQTVTILLAWLAICFTGLVGPVANMAHLVGLLVGVAYAYAEYRIKPLGRLST